MSYIQLAERTSSDSNSAADVNQLQDNFDAVIGGAAPSETLNAQKSRLDNHDTDIADINGNLVSLAVLSSDVASDPAVNTLKNIDDLSFAVTSGKYYYFKAVINYTAAVTTTGSRWTINGPTATFISYKSVYTLTATTLTTNYSSAYDFPSASNATSLTAGNVAEIEGFILPSANGTVVVRFASEIVNSAITAKKGSVLFFKEVA